MTGLPRRAPAPRDKMTPPHTFRLFIISMIIATTIIESPVSANAIHRRPRQESQISDYDTIDLESRPDEVAVDPTTDGALEDAAKKIATTTSAKVYEIKGDPKVEDKIELTTAFILLKTDDGYLKITGLPIYTSSVKDKEQISSQGVSQPSSTKSMNNKVNDKAPGIEELSTAMNSYYMSDKTALDKNNSSEMYPDLTEIKSIEPKSLTTVEFITTTSLSDRKINNETNEKSDLSTISNRKSDPIESNTNTDPPSWKTYTTIDRKRSPQMITSSTDQDVQTTPIRISLDNLLTDTSISSLGQLGESLGSKTTYAFDLSSTSPFSKGTESVDKSPSDTTTATTTTTSSTTIAITKADSTTIDSNKLTSPTTNGSTKTTQGSSPRTLQITSKRAGFLDFSAKPVAEEATTIIESYDIPNKVNGSTGFSSMFEFDSDSDVPENKNKTNMASQSQLVEDVMREEMLKEEMINNEEENASRHKETDQLSVKPIDKSTLYSVGPNYKPMKKLDVQAAKPFIRSPDDLSWRNESISSLGIVFKAKPAAKNFTEVLKNKTETLFSNVNDKDSKNEVPDLRERLEKIAEVRKSKKKKVIDQFGKVTYADYEESSNSAENSRVTTTEKSITTTMPGTNAFKTSETVMTNEPDLTTQISVKHVYDSSTRTETTNLPAKFKLQDYYEAGDDYDDYMNFPKIELKKYTTRLTSQHTPTTTTSVGTSPFQKSSGFYWPDRKPTLQYFPPLPNTPKVKIQTFDENPINKLNYYAVQDTTKTLIPVPVTFTTLQTPSKQVYGQKNRQTVAPNKNKNDLTKTVYYTQPKIEVPAEEARGYEVDANYNRPTYVIKHFKDLVEKASKEEDKDGDYDLQYKSTLSPGRESSADLSKNIPKFTLNADYDYDTGFRKDVINRFVDNFNQNSDRFKVDFPILYNNSVVHRKVEDGSEWATSSAFIKRLYESMSGGKQARARDCDGCERNVDLPPEYELHYYFPGQEETQEAETPHSIYKLLGHHPTRQR